MPNNTPLTDAINALTRYANETTGASDTTLSDAVGTLVAGYGGGGGRLPSDYQEVAYVGVWNNCYFDLGVFSSENPGFHMSYLPTIRNNAGGPHIVSTNNNYLVFAPRGTNTLLKLCGAESINAQSNLGYETTADFNTNSDGKFLMTWNTGTTTTTLTKGADTSGNVYLFAYGGGLSQTQYHFNGLVFSFSLYDDGTIVKNLVPCYRKLDNVIGFYDTINNSFMTTIGSGTLTKGTDI